MSVLVVSETGAPFWGVGGLRRAGKEMGDAKGIVELRVRLQVEEGKGNLVLD